MKDISTVLVSLMLACGSVACQDTVNNCESSTEPNIVELSTWWQTDAELSAAQAVIELHHSKFTNVGILHTKMSNRNLLVSFLRARIARQRTPDTFQISIGSDLATWLEGTRTLDGLDSVWPTRAWKEQFHPTLLESASRDGVPYCVPLDIHRVNTLFYNVTMVASLQDQGIVLNSLSTLEDFRKACAALKSQGITPIVLGTQDASWTLAQLVHESLLPAMAGAAYYEAFWHGRTNPMGDPEMRAVYEEIVSWRRMGWINADFDSLTWDKAGARLVPGGSEQAAFYVMGDWAGGDFKALAATRNTDPSLVSRMAFPRANGNPDFFVYTADCFPLPLGAPHRDAAIGLLDTFASVEGQLVFSQAKGSIPARQDAPLGQPGFLDSMQIDTIAHFYRAETARVLAVSGLVPQGRLAGLSAKLVEMLKTEDTALMSEYWKLNYSQLQ